MKRSTSSRWPPTTATYRRDTSGPSTSRPARPGRPGRRTAGSGEVEPVEVHHLAPRRDEVAHDLLLRVVAGVDLRERAQLGVRPEDQVGPAAGPLDLAGRGVAALEGVRVRGRRLPRRAHVEQVDEEVVGRGPGGGGEPAGGPPAALRASPRQAAD